MRTVARKRAGCCKNLSLTDHMTTPTTPPEAPREAGSRTQHTPGPWLIDRLTRRWGGNTNNRYRHMIQRGEGDEFPSIAEVPSNWTPYQDDHVAEANARLIAAAPDLLAACRELLRYFVPSRDRMNAEQEAAFNTVRAAIARATEGRE